MLRVPQRNAHRHGFIHERRRRQWSSPRSNSSNASGGTLVSRFERNWPSSWIRSSCVGASSPRWRCASRHRSARCLAVHGREDQVPGPEAGAPPDPAAGRTARAPAWRCIFARASNCASVAIAIPQAALRGALALIVAGGSRRQPHSARRSRRRNYGSDPQRAALADHDLADAFMPGRNRATWPSTLASTRNTLRPSTCVDTAIALTVNGNARPRLESTNSPCCASARRKMRS